MDKRWYGIIIILIVGLGCMYLVASSSSSVGSAVIIVNDLSVTLPDNFKINHNYDDLIELKNRDNNETIIVQYIKDGNYSLNEYNKELKNESLDIINKSSDGKVHTIYCKDKDGGIYSLSYFEAYDRTVLIKMMNYSDYGKEQKDMMYVIDTIQPDFKQDRS